MTTAQKKKVLERIVALSKDIQALKNARLEVGLNGYASASLSSGGGSKSYTRLDLDKLTGLINELKAELEQNRNLLRLNSSNPMMTTYIIYS